MNQSLSTSLRSRRGIKSTLVAGLLALGAAGVYAQATNLPSNTYTPSPRADYPTSASTSNNYRAANTSYDANRNSWLPYTRSGYIGLSVGRSDYDVSCGALFACDDKDQAARIYLGGMFNPHFGAEIGYLDAGKMQRAGGDTEARGLNFSLVGNLPLGASRFSVFGKLGATYGRTTTDALPGSGIAAGKDKGWGPSYGVGVSVALSDSWSAVLDWEKHRFHFAGGDRENVQTTSLGLKYSF